MKKLNPRILAILIMIFLIIIFSIQNAEIIQLKLFFWKVNTPRVLLVLFSLVFGILIGLWIPNNKK